MKKIAVIGTGYVGLVTGACLAEMGHQVICADIDTAKIHLLQTGHIPIYEPGLLELVHHHVQEKRLTFTDDPVKAITESEIVFNAVGTPPQPDGTVDLKAVYAVAKTFATHLTGYKLLVNKSTVPVGTNELIKKFIRKIAKKAGPFDIVDNPEFLREGTAVKDFMNPDRIIVGVDQSRARHLMERLYAPLVRTGHPLIFTDVKSAEMIKYAANAFLATKISFINEIANFCEIAGGDIKEIARGVGLDDRIGPRFLHAGIGWGGSCFPKDVKALIRMGQEVGQPFKIVTAAYEVNKKQKELLITKLKAKMPSLAKKTIAIWGLSFKPKTDDIREAPALDIIKQLVKEQAIIQVFDPVARANAKKVIKSNRVRYFKSAYAALKNADALLIATEWNEFRAVDFAKMKQLMAGRVIIDGRNIYDPKEVKKAGFYYEGIGIKT